MMKKSSSKYAVISIFVTTILYFCCWEMLGKLALGICELKNYLFLYLME
jgi:hypothetical protein